MLDEFHRASLKERALKAEGRRESGREDGEGGERRDSCAQRYIAGMCLQRRLQGRFLPKHIVISHKVGE